MRARGEANVESTADTREGGKIVELGMSRVEIVARNGVSRGIWVVVFMVMPDFRLQGGCREVELINRSRRLGGDNITTCLRQGMGDLREEEREDKCSEVDHCERAGL